ncbi:MAG: hypothetical protein IPL35_17850 [Sphingobacteriales bacterium]|nr:hypothetical protein [Sphingobacteriales bacterium]
MAAQFSLPPPQLLGTTYTFTNNSTGGATIYQWKVNGNDVSTTTGFNVHFLMPNIYCFSEGRKRLCSDILSQEITINGSVNDLGVGRRCLLPAGKIVLFWIAVSAMRYFIFGIKTVSI